MDGVVVQEDGGEAFLLHLGTGRYFTLNRTGLVVWRALEAGDDPVTSLGGRFPGQPHERLASDVATVVDSFRRAGLLRSDAPA